MPYAQYLINCIDHLSAGLARLAQTDFPSPYRYDGFDNLRVIAHPVTFAGLTDVAFNQIRQNSSGDVAVTVTNPSFIRIYRSHC